MSRKVTFASEGLLSLRNVLSDFFLSSLRRVTMQQGTAPLALGLGLGLEFDLALERFLGLGFDINQGIDSGMVIACGHGQINFCAQSSPVPRRVDHATPHFGAAWTGVASHDASDDVCLARLSEARQLYSRQP